ncbi:MAG: protoporphyrinogen oxidase [Sulfobacillus acidophilus]|uniref:Coproporphyrinogen III oxidase n=1 Tax=Sulfobacillus acidophilus TaxID=53633 RepID=A0A2T2WEG8_9FIRM|nr:MAG: protoporphyrinogen oxidase [Sulfobacillus acidophilus]
MRRHVAVIGGGISGLAASYRLMQETDESVRISLFESSERLGGVIATDTTHGVVLEAGPDSVLRRKPEFMDLVTELGLASSVIGPNPKARGSYIFHQGHFHDIPRGVQAGIPTRLDSLWSTELLSLGEKVRVWEDLVRPRVKWPEDVAVGDILRQRLGSGYVARIAAPLMSGIYAGDIDQLSAAVTAPQLLAFQARGKSVIRQAKAFWRETPPSPQGLFITLAQGMQTLIDALTRAISERVTLYRRAPVYGITANADGYELFMADGRRVAVTDVVMAVPAYQASALLTFCDEKTRRLLAGIGYADLAVVGAVYRPQAFGRPLDRTGFLVPRGEGLEMTAATWVASKWNYHDYDDEKGVPIRAFFGRTDRRDLLQRSDEEILTIFRQEMGYIMGVTDEPLYERVFRIPAGMPQFRVGHRERMRQLRAEIARWPGLKIVGPYIDGVGVPDCLRHANQAVRELMRSWSQTLSITT